MLTARNKIFIFLFLLFTNTAFASEKEDRHIEVYDPNYPRDAFSKVPNTTVHFHTPGKSTQSVPSVAQRNKIFGEVPGLLDTIGSWKEMDKDILYLHAKHSSLKKLKQSYPQLADTVLSSLKQKVTNSP